MVMPDQGDDPLACLQQVIDAVTRRRLLHCSHGDLTEAAAAAMETERPTLARRA
jgi:hypothetical protein